MKNRNLFTNILSILIIAALAFFLLVQFNVFSNMEQSVRNSVGIASLAVAILSVILIDIVFPVIDHKDRLSEKKYLILLIVKVILFAAAVIVLLLFHPFGVIKNTAVALVSFIVLYFVQFFINLDAKPDDDDDDYEDVPSEEELEEITEVEETADDEIEVSDDAAEDGFDAPEFDKNPAVEADEETVE
ncbi:MAG: hypothetical protein E7384_06320 [Ruminococcaceae bacterium]|nr:hypothetical protein [Oscillospiraceae bacterium]